MRQDVWQIPSTHTYIDSRRSASLQVRCLQCELYATVQSHETSKEASWIFIIATIRFNNTTRSECFAVIQLNFFFFVHI